MKIPRPMRLLVLLALLVQSPAPSCFGQLSSSSSSEREGRPVVVDFLDIGQGDSILVRSPEGKAALIDAGPTRDGAIRTLKSKGIRSIDIVIVTHHHSDHYGGMEQVILNYKPKYFVATGSSHTTRGYLKLLQTVKTEGITAVEPTGKERKVEISAVPTAPAASSRYTPARPRSRNQSVRSCGRGSMVRRTPRPGVIGCGASASPSATTAGPGTKN